MKTDDLRALPGSTAEAFAKMNFTELTPIQREAVPAVYSGRDTVIISPAGTGKTLSCMIPVYEKLEQQESRKHMPQILIVVPTRELALQTAGVSRLLLREREGIRTAVLCGGEDISGQIRRYAKGADIVIGTPSRLKDHLRRHTLKPGKCRCLIIDEADELMKMGFREDVAEIAGQLPDHQTVLMCSTFTPDTEAFSAALLQDPAVCRKDRSAENSLISLFCVIVPENRKLSALRGVMAKYPGPAFIFCRKKTTADFTAASLSRSGFRAAVIHSDMDMAVRRKAMLDFREGRIDAVCSTDVLARGIDVPDIPLCIHYDRPDDIETMIQRTGRTARAGRKGICVFLLTPRQKSYARVISEVFGVPAVFL